MALVVHHKGMLCRIVLLLLIWASLPAATIVCLGDSLTAGKGLDESQAYPALVQQLAQAESKSWRVINAGISGDTTAAGLRRIRWALKAKPDVVFIALGANDGLRGLQVTDMEKNLRAIIEKCRAAGATVVLAGMQLPTNYGEDYRTAFAAVYPALGKEFTIPVMPFLLQDVAAVAALNQADGIHPTAEGQQIMAKNVYQFLLPIIEKVAP